MDSAARIVDCLRIAAAAADLPERTEQQMRHVIGLGMHEAINTLFPDGMSTVQRQRFIAVYRKEFVEDNSTPSALFAGVPEMLSELSAQGYYLSIATGKSRAGLDRVLIDQQLATLFPISRCADETRSKPDPQMLHEILTDFNLSAEQALMIGDTVFDLEMANHAGMHSVAIAQGVHSLQQLQAASPRVVLQRITELQGWLANGSSAVK